MPVRKNIVFLPRFNEWIFNFIRSTTKDIRASLNSWELSWIRTKSSTKRFINSSPIDRKLTLFTRMDMDWALLVFDPHNFDARELVKVYKQYAIDGQPLDNINQMIREQCFVVTGKEVALSLSMMASNCHSTTFRINQEFLKVGENLRDLDSIQKFSDHNENKQFAQAERAQRRIARILFHGLEIADYLNATLGLTPLDIKIFTILFEKPESFFRVDAIQRRLVNAHQPTTVAARCRILFEARYLEKLPTTHKTPSYQIKQKGILAMGDVLNHLVNQSNTPI